MIYKDIPGTLGWKISEVGELLDPNGVVRNTYHNGDGYVTASVQFDTDNAGVYRTIGIHRLVAMTHVPCTGDYDDFQVNHIDGDIENNEVSNLEWVSGGDNNIHAAILRGSKYRPIIIGYKPDGSAEYINTLADAAEKFECTHREVWQAVQHKYRLKGWLLEHNGTRTNVPDDLRKPNFIRRDKDGRPPTTAILIKDVDSEEIVCYNSINEAARAHSTNASHVYQCISTLDRPRLFKKRYFIVKDGNDFPEVFEDELEEMKSPGGKEVIALDIVTGMLFFYPSASSFIKENELSKKAVTTRLKNRQLNRVGKWFFAYRKSELAHELKALMEGPHYRKRAIAIS